MWKYVLWEPISCSLLVLQYAGLFLLYFPHYLFEQTLRGKLKKSCYKERDTLQIMHNAKMFILCLYI